MGESFYHDIVQASTRVNYATNLRHIHGLETMVSMAPEGAMQVDGGNWRIFAEMLKNCNDTCNVAVNTTVTDISFAAKTTDDGAHRYSIKTKPGHDSNSTLHPITFDKVVIATPWQYADIDVEEGVLQHSIDEIPYVTLHVTLFTSPYPLHHGYFNLKPDSRLPTTVLTTLPSGEETEQGAGKPGFYSISTLRMVTNPRANRTEYLYKVFSPAAVTPEFLTGILGARVPESFVSDGSGAYDDLNAESDTISWYYPHVFQSYPKEYPRITFQDIVAGNGIFYTSGIESFISTMETSALMGKNVASLIFEDLADKGVGETVGQEADEADTRQDL